jgi:alkanesulfonate monooxygenase SsuD/methylene tetrahydromethanopterin reductase-like flavin-dependent oxidoreductase (luciferase family)
MRTDVVILPDQTWPELRARWRDADARGFTGAWTYDHLSWRSLRDGPWLGTLPLLGAIAAETSRIRFGTLVTSPNFRHPAVLAKDVMTLDRLSDGRFDLGIGAGGVGYDALALGSKPVPSAHRTARFAEFVTALDLLLREQSVSFAGDFFTAVESRTVPGCVQLPRVPFTIAAAGPKALAVAADQGQTWVTFGPVRPAESAQQWFAAVADQAQILNAACLAKGREPSSIRRLALVGLDLGWAQESIGAWQDFTGQLAELDFTEVALHWPRPEDPELPGPAMSVFDEISARLG